MYHITIYSVGKTKESWLQMALNEYEKRLKPHMAITWALVRDDKELAPSLEGVKSYTCLAPQGKLLDSLEFSTFLQKTLTQQGGALRFVIGGAEGIPKQLIKEGGSILSLSPLTFTHQMVRLILVEQMYRAIQISLGSAYHK